MTTYQGVRLVLSIIGVALIVQSCYGDGKSGKTGEEPVAVHVDKHKSCPNCYIPPWLRRKTKATTTTTTTTTTTHAPKIVHISTWETTKRVIKVKQKKNRKSKLARNQSKVEATAMNVVVLESSTPRSQVHVKDSDTLNDLINSVLEELLKEDSNVGGTKTFADMKNNSTHEVISSVQEHSPVVGNTAHSTGGLNFHSNNHDLHNSHLNFVEFHGETNPDTDLNAKVMEYASTTPPITKPGKKKKKSKSRKVKIPTTQEVPIEIEASTTATYSKVEEKTIPISSSSVSANAVQDEVNSTQQYMEPDPFVHTSSTPETPILPELSPETPTIPEETSVPEKRLEKRETTAPATLPPTASPTPSAKTVISTIIADESTNDQTTLQTWRTTASPILPDIPPETTTTPEEISVPEKRREEAKTASPETFHPSTSPIPSVRITSPAATFPPADSPTPPLTIIPPVTSVASGSPTPSLGITPPTTFPPPDSSTTQVNTVIPTTVANESNKVDQTSLKSWTTTESLVEFSEAPTPIPIVPSNQPKTTVTTTSQPIRIIYVSSSIPKTRKLKQVKVRKPKAPRPVQAPKPVRRVYQLQYRADIETTPKYTPPPSPSPTTKVAPVRKLQRVRQKKSRTTPRHHHRPTFPVTYHPTLPHIRNRHQSISTSTYSTIQLYEFHVFPPTAPSVHGHLLNTDDIDYIIDEYPSDNPDIHSNALHLKGSYKSQNFPMSDTHIFFHDQFE